MTAKQIAAVVLAAGLSSRMGMPKLLLPWGKSTILGSVLKALNQEEIGKVIVVVGAYQEAMEKMINAIDLPVQIVLNPGFENGEMSDSIKIGIRALEGIDAALIVLGDHPQISPDLVYRLCMAFHAGRGDIIVPSYAMKRGHPWLVGKKYWGELETMSSNFTMRDFLHRHSDHIYYVVTDSEEVIADIDTPEDYNKAIKSPPPGIQEF